MKTSFDLVADPRDAQGKGASRRLRRSGKVPAILYGGPQAPRQILLDHQNLLTLLVNERFYSTILSLSIGGEKQAAILKDVQRHPAKNQILHMDLQRVFDNEAIRMSIPLHFKGAAGSPGVKTEGGIVSHLLNQVEVLCLPKDLPEFVEVDMSEMHINDMKRLSDLPLPAGVQFVALAHGRDEPVVSIHHPRAEEAETPAATEAAAAAPAAGAAPAADAKKEEAKPAAGAAKKEGGKK
ncbi:large subunit ribosomal protein L25 [Povalibacter uvarum]|uniref:Large ribosomal subunit protein bL25 n=1 Tax=Povalibacter uvarum TaxID=732238 RepID=A0A841HSV1_9GAMM|nr:50S ribosomal protein L25/general stress protein Ctc [Povalibacter uvarum]MBB6095853.1 large subunit ribosomal protein L25 [Povalibacter uvarum]